MLPFIVTAALFVAPVIAVPWTNATCIAEPWSFNSRTQSPCLVAAYLGASCTSDNTWGILPLRETGGGPYVMPADAGAAGAFSCLCNSVMWNLLSACALCQREPPGKWAQWTASCPNNMITIGKYPVPIPSDVTVPAWAYYDFTTTGVFNGGIASQQLGPESSAISGPTNTRASSPSSTEVGSTSTPRRTQSQSQPSNTGAIIGGVVGGVLGIGLFALIAFVLTRKRKPEDPVTNYPDAGHRPPMTAQFNPVTPMTGQTTPYQFNDSNRPVLTTDYNPYNPSDPSAFPTGPVTPTNGHYVESIPYPYQSQGAQGQQPYPSIPQV